MLETGESSETMMETGESSETQPLKVLLDIPKKHLRVLDEIMKLVDPKLQPLVADVLQMVPKDVLAAIVASEPDPEIKVIECVNKVGGKTRCVRYACWLKHQKLQLIPESVKGVRWQDMMGALRNQTDHDVCWAIVVSELIWAVRQIEKRDEDVNIRYSPQELIDFVDAEQRKVGSKEGHYCYPLNLTKGFEYVKKNGIQREENRPFIGCSKEPIGAALAIFLPEYRTIGDKIYRGPESQNSKLECLHAISLVDAGEENGEKYVLGRTSHGDGFGKDGYIKISLEVVIAFIPTPGEIDDPIAVKYFSKPRSLIGRFSYPRLLTEDEEELRKKMDQDKLQVSYDGMEL
ncbi:unnamed protein product [Microthlaspi erraticum]|uniref:Peptidase C1A papain C-terminal domain-containing protein n=1 Tax=Microthlaspi erraticum TaxID=1685480 RepID=A0A6D2KY94_9BRAS|nr:unnamed protein product [Microthlaspi erraticum]